MVDHNDLFSVAESAAHSSAAFGVLLTDIVCLLAQHPGVDRGLLLIQVKGLYASPEKDEAFQAIYNNYRARIVRGLEKLSQGPTL